MFILLLNIFFIFLFNLESHAAVSNEPLENSQQSFIDSKEKQQFFIAEAERYLNLIQVFVGDFTQIVVSVKNKKTYPQQQGRFYLKKSPNKNYKIRIDLPHQKILILNEILQITDLNTKKTLKYSIDSTPIAHIFSNKLNLNKQFPVHFIHHDPHTHLVYISLQSNRDSLTRISLIFSLYPKNNCIRSLYGWRIQDSQNNVTTVLFNPNSLRLNNKKDLPSGIFNRKIS